MPEAKQNLPYEVLKAAAGLLVEARQAAACGKRARAARLRLEACQLLNPTPKPSRPTTDHAAAFSDLSVCHGSANRRAAGPQTPGPWPSS